MNAHKVPLTIYKGVTFDRSFIWRSGPEGATEPVDLTDCTARAQVRLGDVFGPVLLELSTADESIELGSDGRIRLLLTAAETAAIGHPAGDACGIYDLHITFLDGTVVRRMAGPVHLRVGATHA